MAPATALFPERESGYNIPEPGCGLGLRARGGDARELGDVGGRPGKGSLFGLAPWNQIGCEAAKTKSPNFGYMSGVN